MHCRRFRLATDSRNMLKKKASICAVESRVRNKTRDRVISWTTPFHIQRHHPPMHLFAPFNTVVVYDMCHRMPNRPKPPIPDTRMPALLRCISRGDAFSCRGILSSVVGVGRDEAVAGVALLIRGDDSSIGSVLRCSRTEVCALAETLCRGLSLRVSVGEADCTRYGCLLSPFSRGA